MSGTAGTSNGGKGGSSAGTGGMVTGDGGASTGTDVSGAGGGGAIDDRFPSVPLSTPQEVTALRTKLIQRIWQADGLPDAMPSAHLVTLEEAGKAVPSVKNLRTDAIYQLDFDTLVGMPGSNPDAHRGLAYLLLPGKGHMQSRAVILHGTHAWEAFDDAGETGLRATIEGLLVDGFAVMLMYLPHCSPGDHPASPHAELFSSPTDAHGLRYFLEPTVVATNYLLSANPEIGAIQDVSLLGLEGGGLTTTLAAALDPRIGLSISVASDMPAITVPLTQAIDDEQQIPSRLGVGFADLYVLGSSGKPTGKEGSRRQIHVFNRRNSTFSPAGYDASRVKDGLTWVESMLLTEANVRKSDAVIDPRGRFRVEFDDMALSQKISHYALNSLVLPELGGDRPVVAAAGGWAFYRGLNGNLWRQQLAANSEGIDTGIQILGLPSAVSKDAGKVDVFARIPTPGFDLNLMRYQLSTAETHDVLVEGGLMSGDPVAIKSSSDFELITRGTDGLLFRVTPNDLQSLQGEFMPPLYEGRPAAVQFGGDTHVFARDESRAIRHGHPTGNGWQFDIIDSIMRGFPAAGVVKNSLLVSGRSTDDTIGFKSIDASWWYMLGEKTVAGIPTFGTNGEDHTFWTRTVDSSLYRSKFLTSNSGASWASSPPLRVIGSPVALGLDEAVVSGDEQGMIWVHDGTVQIFEAWLD